LRVIGIDEAGRGPLAGPVVVAAAVFEPGWRIPELNDSKQLTEEQRNALAVRIREEAVAWATAVMEPLDIERWNILGATLRGALRVLKNVQEQLDAQGQRADAVVSDYLKIKTALPLIAESKGDSRSHATAAASVLAKTTRDALMTKWSAMFPMYNWSSNKGYPTQDHRAALATWGPSTMHRLTFGSAQPDFFAAPPTTAAFRMQGLIVSPAWSQWEAAPGFHHMPVGLTDREQRWWKSAKKAGMSWRESLAGAS